LGAPEAFPLLESALQSDNELVVTAAIGALGELGDDRAVPILVTYTSHPDWQLRHRLVQALAAFNQPEAKAALQALRQDAAEIVATAASQHLVVEGG
jgi:HEAT repeat protein